MGENIPSGNQACIVMLKGRQTPSPWASQVSFGCQSPGVEQGELTSSAGVFMSMGSITVNSFFAFFTVDQGLCSLAFTQ